MRRSAVAGVPIGVAKQTWWPASVRTFQLTPASVGSKPKAGSGMRTRDTVACSLLEKVGLRHPRLGSISRGETAYQSSNQTTERMGIPTVRASLARGVGPVNAP